MDPQFHHQTSFTCYDVKTKSYTLLDGFLISDSLKTVIDNVRISQYGNNVSDHVPVELDLHVSIDDIVDVNRMKSCFVNWRLINEEQRTLINEKMAESLSSIQIPTHFIFHGNCCCEDDLHKVDVANYYCDIVKAIIHAESFLPKTNPNFQKSFWSIE